MGLWPHAFRMKRIWVYSLFLLVLSANLKAQTNLVPNHSFESMIICPSTFGQLYHRCDSWYTPISVMNLIPPMPYSTADSSGSSDYFNSCNSGIVSTPINSPGFQIPRSGIAYSGIAVVNNDTLYQYYYQFREYIEVKLNNALNPNREYCGEFYYSMAELPNMGSPARYEMVNLGMLFTDTIVKRASGINNNQPQNIYTTPQISATMGPNKDTINWIKVSGTFIAKGGEQYLTIGSFEKLDTLFGDVFTYIYIDDVSVYYCGEDTTILTPSPYLNVYPSPSLEEKKITFEHVHSNLQGYELIIFNSIGQRVYSYTIKQAVEKQTIPLLHLPQGLYLYTLRNEYNRNYGGKFVIME